MQKNFGICIAQAIVSGKYRRWHKMNYDFIPDRPIAFNRDFAFSPVDKDHHLSYNYPVI